MERKGDCIGREARCLQKGRTAGDTQSPCKDRGQDSRGWGPPGLGCPHDDQWAGVSRATHTESPLTLHLPAGPVQLCDSSVCSHTEVSVASAWG